MSKEVELQKLTMTMKEFSNILNTIIKNKKIKYYLEYYLKKRIVLYISNERTGKEFKSPKGVESAFANNAGKEKTKTCSSLLVDKFAIADDTIVHVDIKDMVGSYNFTSIYEKTTSK